MNQKQNRALINIDNQNGWEDNGKTKHAKTMDSIPRLQLQKTH
jgi:hypothetical protein